MIAREKEFYQTEARFWDEIMGRKGIVMNDLYKVVYELARKDIDRSAYEVVVVPPDHSLLKGKFYGFAKDDPKDMRVYISSAIKDVDQREFILAHEFVHKTTDIDNEILDEIVANLIAAIHEPEGFAEVVEETLKDEERMKGYFLKYIWEPIKKWLGKIV